MGKIIFELPVGVAVELASGDTAYSDIGGLFAASFFAPFDANLGGEARDVFIILKVSPKFYLGAGFLT